MNPTLVKAGIDQLIRFYCIGDEQPFTSLSPDEDLFIGEKQDVTFSIVNGTTVKVRDIVVLGRLSVQSSDMESTASKGRLVARNLFTPGYVLVQNSVARKAFSPGQFFIQGCHVTAITHYVPKSVEKFKQDIQDILIDWFAFQRESVNRVGLRSILA